MNEVGCWGDYDEATTVGDHSKSKVMIMSMVRLCAVDYYLQQVSKTYRGAKNDQHHSPSSIEM